MRRAAFVAPPVHRRINHVMSGFDAEITVRELVAVRDNDAVVCFVVSDSDSCGAVGDSVIRYRRLGSRTEVISYEDAGRRGAVRRRDAAACRNRILGYRR